MIAVFAGISLSDDALDGVPGAELLPPIARGDLGKAYDAGKRLFAIVDGVFDQTRAVAPAEILEIMRIGGRVLGSSSMGAMRAAELDGEGMVGVGRIYELVRRTPAFRDDWLGHLFDPFTHALVTLPFIEIVGAIGDAVKWEKRRLDAAVRKVDEASDVRFDELTPDATKRILAHVPKPLRASVTRRVAQIWREPRTSLKCRDARLLIEHVTALARDVEATNRALRELEPIRPR